MMLMLASMDGLSTPWSSQALLLSFQYASAHHLTFFF
ncbi:hypothetical protein FOPG_18819 [Fusarium oxysporum f. sp. conglutinans race 2 54008]|uniref:Uncharacterized protein n=1 Tax=Fusarium oxysporum f. sp. conglutinans race 2 54008 TaxID=1089457 RepID=X0GMU2_FUSOX|nr:hypothetical protein FOPG_18819 [Fusarium oxysporum f. sp. conglutinans race 2 54008]